MFSVSRVVTLEDLFVIRTDITVETTSNLVMASSARVNQPCELIPVLRKALLPIKWGIDLYAHGVNFLNKKMTPVCFRIINKLVKDINDNCFKFLSYNP